MIHNTPAHCMIHPLLLYVDIVLVTSHCFEIGCSSCRSVVDVDGSHHHLLVVLRSVHEDSPRGDRKLDSKLQVVRRHSPVLQSYNRISRSLQRGTWIGVYAVKDACAQAKRVR